jgi:hypothetical protein
VFPVSVEHASAGNRAKKHNSHNNDLEAMEEQHINEESESKIAPWQSPQVDTMIKKKGVKFVIKTLMPIVEPPENTVLEMNEMPDCISIGNLILSDDAYAFTSLLFILHYK